MKQGFTLSEVMITLVILGVIAAMTIPSLMNRFSSINKYQYRTAFKIVESVVADMVQEDSIFTDGTLTNDNTNHYFCTQFIRDVNTTGTAASCTTPSVVPGTPNFSSTNGMRWYGFETDFNADTVPTITIQVDVDGEGHGENTLGKDIFNIIVTNTGKVTTPDGSTETDYLLK